MYTLRDRIFRQRRHRHALEDIKDRHVSSGLQHEHVPQLHRHERVDAVQGERLGQVDLRGRNHKDVREGAGDGVADQVPRLVRGPSLLEPDRERLCVGVGIVPLRGRPRGPGRLAVAKWREAAVAAHRGFGGWVPLRAGTRVQTEQDLALFERV